MAIQATPPIQLDPSMDKGHQLAFINQNFLSIANVLSQNSFVIVSQGLATVGSGSTQTWATIPHNLGYRPIILAFLNNVGLGTIFTSGDIPLPAPLSTNINLVSGNVETRASIFAAADATNAYIILFNATGSSIGSFDVKYYLLQQTSKG